MWRQCREGQDRTLREQLRFYVVPGSQRWSPGSRMRKMWPWALTPCNSTASVCRNWLEVPLEDQCWDRRGLVLSAPTNEILFALT